MSVRLRVQSVGAIAPQVVNLHTPECKRGSRSREIGKGAYSNF